MARLDHCVLPTADLARARDRLAALGFTVAPEGIHPFGTRNACVYFADGTFLEPLAVGDDRAAKSAIGQGNVFVARDAHYRKRCGEEGFSAVVIRSDDADEDHRRFVRAGVSAGDRLDFERPFLDTIGRQDVARFRLAFAGVAGAPDALFFTCERPNAPAVDRGALERHANGVTGISRVVLTAGDPGAFGGLLSAFTGSETALAPDGVSIALGSSRIEILRRDVFAATFGSIGDDDVGLRLRAIEFAGLAATGLGEGTGAVSVSGGKVAVAPTAGQGAYFVFKP